LGVPVAPGRGPPLAYRERIQHRPLHRRQQSPPPSRPRPLRPASRRLNSRSGQSRSSPGSSWCSQPAGSWSGAVPEIRL